MGEIAFQGALDKIVWTYYNRSAKGAKGGDEDKENEKGQKRLEHGSRRAGKVHMGDNDDYESYEPEDYLEALHASAVNFVNAVTKSTSINLLLAFDENDIKKLVQVSLAIYGGFDALKLKTHLETLERMVNNDDKLALMMCQQGLVARIAEIMYRIGGRGTTSKTVSSRADPMIENEDGELTSQNYIYQQCRKTILRIFVSLFSKT